MASSAANLSCRQYFVLFLVTGIAISFPITSFAQADSADPAAAPDLRNVSAADVNNLIQSYHGKPVLLNIWATWCKPCREEMPELLHLREVYREAGFELILVSSDFLRERKAAANFLGTLGVDFQTYIKDQVDNEFIDLIDPNWSGALPYSALIAADGSVLRTWEGKLTFTEVSELLSP